jgi:hypothetical protein
VSAPLLLIPSAAAAFLLDAARSATNSAILSNHGHRLIGMRRLRTTKANAQCIEYIDFCSLEDLYGNIVKMQIGG